MLHQLCYLKLFINIGIAFNQSLSYFNEHTHALIVRCDCEGVYLNIVTQLQYFQHERDIKIDTLFPSKYAFAFFTPFSNLNHEKIA